jgi:hypothetical protein
LGLSTAHISTPGELACPSNGSVVVLKERLGPRLHAGGGRRGRVAAFSRQSRARMQQRLGMIDRDTLARDTLFVSLSFRAGRAPDAAHAKENIEEWFRRVLRRFPRLWAVWRLEWQENGSPHFHMFLGGYSFIPMRFLKATWCDVTDDHSDGHYVRGCDVQKPQSIRGVVRYTSKYLAKIAGQLPLTPPGRLWGIVGRENVPALVIRWLLTEDGLSEIHRVLSGILALRGVKARDGPIGGRGIWLYLEPESLDALLKQVNAQCPVGMVSCAL